MPEKSLLYLFVIATLAGLSACHKTRHNPPNPVTAPFTGCRIAQISEVFGNTTFDTTVYTFRYNDDGTVANIYYRPKPLGDSMIKTFTYKTNYILINTTDNQSLYSTDSLALDAHDRVIYINHYNNLGALPQYQPWDSYSYDSVGHLVTQEDENDGTTTYSTFYWKNGDLMWNTSGTDFINYTYDTTLYSTGNITARPIDFETYGRSIYTPLHRVVYSLRDSSIPLYIQYTSDASGKITNVFSTDSSSGFYDTQITYSCE